MRLRICDDKRHWTAEVNRKVVFMKIQTKYLLTKVSSPSRDLLLQIPRVHNRIRIRHLTITVRIKHWSQFPDGLL